MTAFAMMWVASSFMVAGTIAAVVASGAAYADRDDVGVCLGVVLLGPISLAVIVITLFILWLDLD